MQSRRARRKMKARWSDRKRYDVEQRPSARGVRDFGASDCRELSPRPPGSRTSFSDEPLSCKYCESTACTTCEPAPERFSGKRPRDPRGKSTQRSIDDCGGQVALKRA